MVSATFLIPIAKVIPSKEVMTDWPTLENELLDGDSTNAHLSVLPLDVVHVRRTVTLCISFLSWGVAVRFTFAHRPGEVLCSQIPSAATAAVGRIWGSESECQCHTASYGVEK